MAQRPLGKADLARAGAALLCAAFVALTLPARDARAEGAPLVQQGATQPLALGYKIYAGGLHVFSFEAEVDLSPARYETALALRSDGWLAWLWTFSLAAEVRGQAGPEGLAPRRFRTESEWRDSARWVEISYDAAGRPTAEAEPPPEEDDRDPVPEADRIGTVDPITAALGLVDRLMRTDSCDGQAEIFDGRRSFAASATDLGAQSLTTSDVAPYGGSAVACRLSIVPVKGFWKNPDYPPKPQELTVFLRSVVPNGPPVPVRIEADTRFGGIRGHLISAQPAGGTQKVSR